ncbi:sushi, von Willebrand factor type A, EGF and pentraxin domain-containing protein 1-like [Glandiceps talaboti]
MRVIQVLVFMLSLLAVPTFCNDILNSPLSRDYPQGKSELVFLLDRSGSVGGAHFEVEKVFVENVLAQFSVAPDATRVCVISYSENVIRHIDYIREPKNKCHFAEEMQVVRYENAGKTNTKAALEEARIVLVNSRPGINKAVILLSDGQSNVGGDPTPIATQIKNDGVEIFTLGVGLFDRQELDSIATSQDHTFDYDSFSEFKKLARRIRGDPHDVRWDTGVTLDTCDSLCSDPIESFGCCDIDAKCTCALVGGSRDCVCGPGSYGNSGLMGHCTACPRGTYKDSYEPSTSCTPCPDNSNTEGIGRRSLSACQCNEGYEGDLVNGQPCIVRTCPKLRAPPNGKMSPHICDNAFNTQCQFSCDHGYQLVDIQSQTRRCLPTGVWSGSEAVCTKSHCANLAVPADGSKECTTNDDEFGTVCEFKCKTGFLLSGSRYRKCTENGQWSGEDTTCRGRKCPLLPAPVNGRVNPRMCATEKQNYKRICVFTCNQGYKLVGPEYKLCLSTTQWSDQDVGNQCVDDSPPEIECPETVQVSTDAGLSSALVQWALPRMSDNSGLEATVSVQPVGLQSPHRFNIGSHVITYTATDANGLSTSCSFKVIVTDEEAPRIAGCPDNIDQRSPRKKTVATWNEPEFIDNSEEELEISTSHSSGVSLSWGSHTVTYTARDSSGNEAVCQFRVRFYPSTCPPYPEPVNGARVCDDWLFGMFCRVTCNQKYEFARKPAEWYICNAEGDWRTQPPGLDTPWPDCSELFNPRKVRKGLKTQYYAGNCNNQKTKKMIKKVFIEEFTNSIFGQTGGCLVAENACKLKSVTVYCGAINDTIGRRKRDVTALGYENVVTIEFTIFGEVTDTTEDDDVAEEQLNVIINTMDDIATSFESQARQGQMTLTVENELLVVNDESVETNSTVLVCGNGTVLVDRKCVNCPVGMYYDEMSDKCQLCSPGYFQDEEAQFECKQCDVGTSTIGTQAKNFTECVDVCIPGTYSSNGLATCKSCPKGTYQPEDRQTSCIPCPPLTTTSIVGAARMEDCQAKCVPGSFSPSGVEPCSPCQVGYYQSEFGQRSCLPCEGTLTTYGVGTMSVNQCTVIDHCASNPCYNDGSCTNTKKGYKCECNNGYTGSNCQDEIDECRSSPCAFNSTCLDRTGGFDCVCQPGYTGLICDQEVDECQLSPCLHSGQCQDEVNDFQCVCVDGYSGNFCEIVPDNCASNPCQNNGSCIQVNDNFVCACHDGFTGLYCEVNMDECQSNPCMNGAECQDADNAYRCHCVRGFQGQRCEIDIDDCLHQECQNSATCVDSIDGYFCKCPPSFSGRFCENELSVNFDLSFQRRVTTDYAILNSYTLPELNTFTIAFWMRTSDSVGTILSYATTVGDHTEDNTILLSYYDNFKLTINGEDAYTDSEVADNEWHHVVVTWANEGGRWQFYMDGVVQSSGEHFQEDSIVPGGGSLILGQEQDELGGGFNPSETFIGDMSRLNIWNSVLTESDIVVMASHCSDRIGNIVAWSDFELNTMAEVEITVSAFCEEIDLCLSSPCDNGGTCEDNISGFTCHCVSGYHGDRCEIRALHCDPDPCNHGKCDDDGDGYICYCDHGYEGSHCNIEVNECDPQPCYHGATCRNEVGHFVCLCPPGYTGSRCENEIMCHPPYDVQYADVVTDTPDLTFGSVAIYECHQGYRQSGTSLRLTCDDKGQWSGGQVICSDTDECTAGVSDCQQLCFNEEGGYYCGCSSGYQLNSDNRNCVDVNECVMDEYGQDNGGCDYDCVNTLGSFYCVCPDGFELINNNKDCQDIDECTGGTNDCQHGCRNLPGNYICECNPGFTLNEDGKHCDAIPCETLPNPSNGMVFSFLRQYFFGSRVMIQCYPGYKLIGSNFRSCDQTGTWSGSPSRCIEIDCGPIGVMENGEITGSSSKFGDGISFVCNHGFELVGSQVQVCEGLGKWSGTRPYCKPTA